MSAKVVTKCHSFAVQLQVTSAHLSYFSNPNYEAQLARRFTNSPYDSFAVFDTSNPTTMTLGLSFNISKDHYQVWPTFSNHIITHHSPLFINRYQSNCM